MKVLDVAIDQILDSDGFTASAEIRTSGLLSLFRKVNLKAEGRGPFDNAVAQPRTFSFVNLDGKKNRRVTATWTAGDVTPQSQPRYPDLGDPPATREQKLEAADPLTILTRVTVLPNSQKPRQGKCQFFDGTQRYNLEYDLKGPTPVDARERRLGQTSTVRCSLVYREVAGFKKKPQEQRSQGLARGVTVGLGRLGPAGPWVISCPRADTVLCAAGIDRVNVRMTGERRS